MSRGGFLGVLAVGLYYFVSSRHKVRDLGIVMVASAVFLFIAPREFIDEMYTIRNTDDGTAEKRQFLWATAFNIWTEFPVVGGGGGNFQYLAGDFQPTAGDWPPEYFQRSSSGTVTHSLYFQLLSEQGLIGVGLFGWLVYEHFRTLRRLRRDVHARRDASPNLVRDVDCYAGALGAAAVGFLAAGGFISTLYYPYLWYFGGMTVALGTIARRELAASAERVNRDGRSSVERRIGGAS
jgi:O-antigen ligase